MSDDSRSSTPDSQGSLRDATATIDDLTRALANFSRARSPEPLEIATCCCGREECETSKAWATVKAKLESRLVLSAEVGQALLERHEAYVRRHESYRRAPLYTESDTEDVDGRMAALIKENANLQRRLSQALVHSELIETTHQTSLLELKNAKDSLTRLTAQHARSIGVENRLAVATQEKEDLQQERDSATQRARMAEARISSLKEKCSKLRAQVDRLREDLEMQRSHRQELSEEILTDARQRLQQLQQLHLGNTPAHDDSEMTKVLESLVADNEALKRDNAELQNILAETREDMRALQEEIDERRAHEDPISRHNHTSSVASSTYHELSPTSPNFRFGFPGTMLKRSTSASRGGIRSVSTEQPRRVFEPLTPETDRRSDVKRTSFTPFSIQVDEDTSPQGIKPLLLLKRTRGVQTDGTGAGPSSSAASLLAPSPVPRGFGDHISSSSPFDGQSDSSSVADGQSSVLGILLERVSILTNRLIQADALTLTNRLKRQHLHGADVSHISRNTVSGVIQELNTLRTLFRGFLEDDKVTTACTRKDLRGLFKLFKDLLSEMGQLRVTLNDVILDPTIAGKISDMAMHPSKATITVPTQSDAAAGSSSTPAWIAPLSKLLGLPGASNPDLDPAARALSPPMRSNSRGRRPPPRVVPKREAALAATSTTVNVEFTGAGAGRVASSTTTVSPSVGASSTLVSPASVSSQSPIPPSVTVSTRGLMDIFAGAPRPAADPTDPWIVVPKPQRAVSGRAPALTTSHSTGSAASATVGRSTLRHFSSTAKFDGEGVASQTIGRGTASRKALSRVVDAMIDRDIPTSPTRRTGNNGGEDEDPDDESRDVVNDTLLERTLRPRGLSDSSIHTTFMNHGEDPPSSSEHGGGRSVSDNSSAAGGDGGRTSVLRALSRRVQSFRIASAAFASTAVTSAVSAVPSRPQTPSTSNSLAPTTFATSATTATNPSSPDLPTTSHPASSNALQRSASPTTTATATASGIFPSLSLSSWAAAAAGTLDEHTPHLDAGVGPGPYSYLSSPKDEGLMSRGWAREREM
ncbi:hypothetical protein BXZ70DRAFT_945422 [Cristinia sonorae]|uniref:Uncharacterized protein n=1 Tax=Cristinia sonorae TaxID=1940300 RepID=A0A8K0XNT0_9AGAR|nr:hypothetical protein BXZ70DRAFT_945422 [Cristinia sonorae]